MNQYIQELLELYPLLHDCVSDIQQAYSVMRDCYRAGGKVLICGNGGSAADAEHWSGELMKGFHTDRPLSGEQEKKLGRSLAEHLQGALPTIPLTGFISLSTAFANDADSEYLFAQMVWGLGKESDILVAISTSGNSRNILHALQTAVAMGMNTVGLTGKDGGGMKEITDVCIRVPAASVHRVQEYHLPVYHCLCSMLEEEFFPGTKE